MVFIISYNLVVIIQFNKFSYKHVNCNNLFDLKTGTLIKFSNQIVLLTIPKILLG